MPRRQLRFWMLIGALLVVGLAAAAQGVQTASTTPMRGLASASFELYFPKMEALNAEIIGFQESLSGIAHDLEDTFGGDWVRNARDRRLTASHAEALGVLHSLAPSVAIGVEAEYLALEYRLACDFNSPGKSVLMTIDLSAPAGGALVVLAADSTELVDLGIWSIGLSAGVGYYNMTAKMQKNIQVHGIPAYAAESEMHVTTGVAAWGTKASLSVASRISDALSLEFSAAWRSLTFREIGVNFNDPEQAIDLDFSGLTVSVGMVLRF